MSVFLKDKDPKLIAAYKIYAYTRYYDLRYAFVDELEKGMNKFDQYLYGWWNGNAKNVLPPLDHYHIPHDLTRKDWEMVVVYAAEVWKKLSEEWEIIMIPDHMNRDSNEYLEFQEYSQRKTDEIEYQNYLRLKEKFEKEEIQI